MAGLIASASNQSASNLMTHHFELHKGRLSLIDFRAVEVVSIERVDQLRERGRALRSDDLSRIEACSDEVGFTVPVDPKDQREGVIGLMRLTA